MLETFPERSSYLPQREQAIVQQIERFAGKELYRPRADIVRECLLPYHGLLPKIKVAIAGTNGKGQVACELAYYLHRQKISHSLFTSPHILGPTERLSYNGKNISCDDLEFLLSRAQELLAREHLSFYELLFFAFALGHERHPADVMIMEVGLGGRFDAVNSIDPTLTAIVSIGHDHMEILGHSLEQILLEKLGITRPCVPLLSTITQDNLRQLCKDYCEQNEIPWIDVLASKSGPRPLSYRDCNRLLALELAKRAGVPPSAPLAQIPTKGRWETLGSFTFVSAHNIDGLQAVDRILSPGEFTGIIFSFSNRDDDSLSRMFDILSSWNCPLYFSKQGHFKKITPSKWPLLTSAQFIEGFYPPGPGPFLVIGSNYFIGEFQKAILS